MHMEEFVIVAGETRGPRAAGGRSSAAVDQRGMHSGFRRSTASQRHIHVWVTVVAYDAQLDLRRIVGMRGCDWSVG